MQHKPRYRVMRNILYPYNGQEPLSLKQCLRVMLGWVLFFPVCISLLTLPVAVLSSYTLQKTEVVLIFAFLSSAFFFGMLGLLIVTMSNKAARFRQAQKTRVGRYYNQWR
jgi:hypothetical protein